MSSFQHTDKTRRDLGRSDKKSFTPSLRSRIGPVERPVSPPPLINNRSRDNRRSTGNSIHQKRRSDAVNLNSERQNRGRVSPQPRSGPNVATDSRNNLNRPLNSVGTKRGHTGAEERELEYQRQEAIRQVERNNYLEERRQQQQETQASADRKPRENRIPSRSLSRERTMPNSARQDPQRRSDLREHRTDTRDKFSASPSRSTGAGRKRTYDDYSPSRSSSARRDYRDTDSRRIRLEVSQWQSSADRYPLEDQIEHIHPSRQTLHHGPSQPRVFVTSSRQDISASSANLGYRQARKSRDQTSSHRAVHDVDRRQLVESHARQDFRRSTTMSPEARQRLGNKLYSNHDRGARHNRSRSRSRSGSRPRLRSRGRSPKHGIQRSPLSSQPHPANTRDLSPSPIQTNLTGRRPLPSQAELRVNKADQRRPIPEPRNSDRGSRDLHTRRDRADADKKSLPRPLSPSARSRPEQEPRRAYTEAGHSGRGVNESHATRDHAGRIQFRGHASDRSRDRSHERQSDWRNRSNRNRAGQELQSRSNNALQSENSRLSSPTAATASNGIGNVPHDLRSDRDVQIVSRATTKLEQPARYPRASTVMNPHAATDRFYGQRTADQQSEAESLRSRPSSRSIPQTKRRSSDAHDTSPIKRAKLDQAQKQFETPESISTPRAARPIKRIGSQNNSHTEDLPKDMPSSAHALPASHNIATEISCYERIGQVGEGTYGKVYKACHRVTKEYVALKRIRLEQEKDGFPITSVREIKLLQRLRHPGVVKLLEMMIEKGSVYMVFEYMDHDLTGLLANPSVKFEIPHIKDLASQLFQGLAYLHHRGVLHRDLKASNLLLDNAGQLKLADFGLARFYHKSRLNADYTNRVITLWFRPPELLLGATAYDAAVDIWSAGCIFIELFTKATVFAGRDEIHQLETIYSIMGSPSAENWPSIGALPWFELIKFVSFEPQFEQIYSPKLPSDALSLSLSILSLDPARRLSAAEVLQHPYFTSEMPKAERLDLSGIKESHEWDTKQRRRDERAQRAKEEKNGGQQVESG